MRPVKESLTIVQVTVNTVLPRAAVRHGDFILVFSGGRNEQAAFLRQVTVSLQTTYRYITGCGRLM